MLVCDSTAAPQAVAATQNAIAAEFETLLPELMRLAKPFVGKCADPDEALAEICAFSFWNYCQAARKGFRPTPMQMLFVARRRVCSGRVFGNSESAQCVFSPIAKRKNHVRIHRLSEFHDRPRRHDSKIGRRFFEVIAGDQRNPAEIARIRLDWSALRRKLSDRQNILIDGFAVGRSNTETARKLRLSPGRVTQILPELRSAVQDFFGAALPVEFWEED